MTTSLNILYIMDVFCKCHSVCSLRQTPAKMYVTQEKNTMLCPQNWAHAIYNFVERPLSCLDPRVPTLTYIIFNFILNLKRRVQKTNRPNDVTTEFWFRLRMNTSAAHEVYFKESEKENTSITIDRNRIVFFIYLRLHFVLMERAYNVLYDNMNLFIHTHTYIHMNI